jgi:hypothetical protein
VGRRPISGWKMEKLFDLRLEGKKEEEERERERERDGTR